MLQTESNGAETETQQQEETSQLDVSQNSTVDELEESADQVETAKSQNCELKEDTQSSFTHSEELSEDYYDECWLDGEKFPDDVESDPKSVLNPDSGQMIKDNKEIYKYKNDHNATSKTLGISSDGAAVIEEKLRPPAAKRARKEKRTHICEICGNIYDRRYTLVAHMRRHRDEKPFECE